MMSWVERNSTGFTVRWAVVEWTAFAVVKQPRIFLEVKL